MDSTFLYSGTYEDIIQTIAKWRILSLTNLKEEVNYNFSYQAFAKKVGRLEKEDFVGSFFYENNKKYLYLTSKGLKEAGLDKAWPINKEIVVHDLISVNTCRYFIKSGEFMKGFMHLDEAGKTTKPDCALYFNEKYKVRTMAVEIELTQKSFSRIESKFNKYNDSGYDLVLYVFQKPSVFEAYKNAINNTSKFCSLNKLSQPSKQIILLLEPEIRKGSFSLLKSVCYFNTTFTNLEEILKEHLIHFPKS